MTSNIGSKVKVAVGLAFGCPDYQYTNISALVNEELKQYFRPEFLNRLDEIIVFRQLTKDEVKQISQSFYAKSLTV